MAELTISIITAIVIALWLLFLLILIVKNFNTFEKRQKIINAIGAYLRCVIEEGGFYPYSNAVDFDDMESYKKTFFRLWDWGYTRILPPEKFEIIKPFIKK